MSLQLAAQHLASKGRNGDTELVHMTKGEIKGLQELALAHGGSLSINPDTGLVEASWLKNLLPTIAGIGLSMIPGVGPLAAAGMVGGFETLRTGDIGRGLMAGLGAYGGAGLGGSLANIGAGTGASAGLGGTGAGVTAAENLGVGTVGTAPGVSSTVGQMASASGSAVPSATSTAPSFMGNASNAMQGLKDVTGSGQAALNFGKQNLMNIGMAAAPALTDAMSPQTPTPGQAEEDPRYKGSPYRYNLASNFQGFTPARPSPYYTPTGLGYAAGGDIMMAAGGSYDDEPRGDDQGYGYAAGGDLKIGEGIAKDTDEDTASLGAYDAARKRVEKQFGAANLKAKPMPKTGIARLGEIKTMASGGLGGYSDGGRMLKGPGDGMSDSIPAVIGKKQPARLADGEFVVPADVVSHLGNGSTDAGAKRLYSMMDKVRQARTGKKKQAPAVKADKYMPA